MTSHLHHQFTTVSFWASKIIPIALLKFPAYLSNYNSQRIIGRKVQWPCQKHESGQFWRPNISAQTASGVSELIRKFLWTNDEFLAPAILSILFSLYNKDTAITDFGICIIYFHILNDLLCYFYHFVCIFTLPYSDFSSTTSPSQAMEYNLWMKHATVLSNFKPTRTFVEAMKASKTDVEITQTLLYLSLSLPPRRTTFSLTTERKAVHGKSLGA